MGGAYWLVSLCLSAQTPSPPDLLPPPPGTRHLQGAGLAVVDPSCQYLEGDGLQGHSPVSANGSPIPTVCIQAVRRKKDGPQRTLGVSQQLIQVLPPLLLSQEEYTGFPVVVGGSRSLSLFKD